MNDRTRIPASGKQDDWWCITAGLAATAGAILGTALVAAAIIAAIAWGLASNPHAGMAILTATFFAVFTGAMSTGMTFLVCVVGWAIVGEPVMTRCRKKRGLETRNRPGGRPGSGRRSILTGGACGAAASALATIIMVNAWEMEPESTAILAGIIVGTLTGAGLGAGITINFVREND